VARAKIELDLKQIEALAARGLTQAEICAVVGISESTLYRLKRKMTEMTDAIKRGRAQGHAVVANALYESAKGGNVTAGVWYEKTRCGITEERVLLERIDELEKKLAHIFDLPT
jgi:DNA-binding CsgD family transcriptional regulator